MCASFKEKVLRWAINELKYRNVTLRVYQDMSETLAIKRVAFNDIKQKLYRKRDFGLSYPSSLCITFEGESIYFDSTGQAKAFYDQWIAG